MNFDEITLIYKVKGEIEVQLFNKGFVERNKKNCKLIIEGKEQEFTDKYRFGIFFGTDKDIFEIKLKGITKITSIKEMFYNCSSFLTSPDISKWNMLFHGNIRMLQKIFFCSFESIFSNFKPKLDILVVRIAPWNTVLLILLKLMDYFIIAMI